MSYRTQYVHLPDDQAEHVIGDGQRTACGEPIPYNSPWTTEPEGKVCTKCEKAIAKVADRETAAEAAAYEHGGPVETTGKKAKDGAQT
jgi:hypothetical protein